MAYTEKQLIALEALRKNAVAYAKQIAKPRQLIEKEELKQKVKDYVRDNSSSDLMPTALLHTMMPYQRRGNSLYDFEQFINGLLDAISIEIYGERWNWSLYDSTNKNGLVWITKRSEVDYTYIVCIKYPDGNVLDLRLSENFELLRYDYIKGGAFGNRRYLDPASPEIVNKVYSILVNGDIGTEFVDAFINSAEEVKNES